MQYGAKSSNQVHNPSAIFTSYKQREEIDIDLEEKPVRDTNAKTGTFGGRQHINIDENDDTIHNAQDLSKLISRGQKLRERMGEALADDPWEQLHGPNEVHKTYVNPFMKPNSLAAAEESKKKDV